MESKKRNTVIPDPISVDGLLTAVASLREAIGTEIGIVAAEEDSVGSTETRNSGTYWLPELMSVLHASPNSDENSRAELLSRRILLDDAHLSNSADLAAMHTDTMEYIVALSGTVLGSMQDTTIPARGQNIPLPPPRRYAKTIKTPSVSLHGSEGELAPVPTTSAVHDQFSAHYLFAKPVVADPSHVADVSEWIDSEKSAWSPGQRQTQCYSPAKRNPVMNGIFDLQDRNLTDDDFAKVVQSTQGLSNVHGVNLKYNQVGDTSLAAVLSLVSPKLAVLDISHNKGISAVGIAHTGQLLKSLQLTSLTSLSMAGIQLNGPDLSELTSNLNPSTTPFLETLNLSATGLGRWDDVGTESLAFTLVQMRQLKLLDLSRNCLRAKHLTMIGESLAEMDTIQTLDVSYNSTSYMDTTAGSNSHKIPSINAFCSSLGSISSLTHIRLISTGMNDESAFVLADSLCVHPNITSIDVSENPGIGLFGIRSLLKLLLFNETPAGRKISTINMAHSFNSSFFNFYNFSDSSGRYILEMANPFHMAVARQCLRRWEVVNTGSDWYTQTFDETFIDMKVDGEKFMPEKDAENVWILPGQGVLSFTAVFKLRRREDLASNAKCAMESPLSKPTVVNDRLLTNFMDGVFSTLHSIDNKAIVIEAISQFLVFGCDLSRWILSKNLTFHMKLRTLEKMLPKVVEPWRLIHACEELVRILPPPSNGANKSGQVTQVSRVPLWFEPSNPTGHYALNLSVGDERMIAAQLIEIAKFNFEYCKPEIITSFRNGSLNGTEFAYFPDWLLPTSGVWEFDFISPHRYPLNLAAVPEAIHEETWTRVCSALVNMTNSADPGGVTTALEALRKISGQVFITCAQLVTLLHNFQTHTAMKLDIVCILFRRIVDYPDVKEMLCRARMGIPALLEPADVAVLESRVGKLSLLNPLKADNTSFECDLATVDGRTIAQIILTLLAKEKGSRLINSRIGDTTATAVPAEPPKKWRQFIPLQGVWLCTYVAEEKGINRNVRKDLSMQHCGFDQRTFAHEATVNAGKKK